MLEEKIIRSLTKKHRTLSTAESCTGGLLAHRLTNVPGSSKVFVLGVVLYSNQAKSRMVKVPASLIQSHGAVSQPVAVAMAQGVRKLMASDYGIAITGIAGPSGGSKTKPLGLTFIAVSQREKTSCIKCLFKGRREQIKSKAATQALKILYRLISA